VRNAVGGDLPQQLAERIALAAFLALNPSSTSKIVFWTPAQAAISALIRF